MSTPDPVEIYKGLRSRALTYRPNQILAPDEPFGIVMETGYPNAVATLVAMSEGDVSLYFSNGGGVLGGVGHESVRQAGTAFVAKSVEYLSDMATTALFPPPKAGRVRFFVLMPRLTYTYEAQENALGEKRDKLWPLFYYGHATISALREITEKPE